MNGRRRTEAGVVRWRSAVLPGLLVLAGQGVAVAQLPTAPPPADGTPAESLPADAPLQLPPVVPAPGPGMLIVSCDPGGCWDEFGMRYDRADAGVFIRRDGRSCLMVKGRMRCE